MSRPEQGAANEVTGSDSQKEQIGQTIFQVRFGLGPHTLKLSDWHETLVQDLDSFFQPSASTQLNVLFVEEALGSQEYQRTVRNAYKNYGKYTTAFAYARFHRLSDGFPPAEVVETRLRRDLQRQHPFAIDGSKFFSKIFGTIDEIVERKKVAIDIEVEKRSDPKERQQVESILRQAQLPKPRTVEEFRQHALALWNMKRIRDKKIVEDLAGLYKKVVKKGEPMKVYVSLGQHHSGVARMLSAKLNKRPSHEITVVSGELHQQQNEIFSEAIALLDTSEPISADQWQIMYEASTRTS